MGKIRSRQAIESEGNQQQENKETYPQPDVSAHVAEQQC
jgi:hypothetical protein